MADESEFRFYRYNPSLAANVVFIVLFAALSAGHLFQLIKRRTWYFIPFLIGCLFETFGYVARVASSTETPNWTLTPFIIQTLLILLAPALYAASIYMVLGRLIRLLDAHQHSLIRTNWLTKIFVLGDVLSFLTQSAGGGLLANATTASAQSTGKNVVLAGLGIQVIFFGLFILTTIVFHYRISKDPTARSLSVTTPWRLLVVALYFSSTLVMVRSVFRMVEYGMGNDGVLMRGEVWLFVFDGVLMMAVSAVFLWWYPGGILVGYKGMGDGREEGFAMVGEAGEGGVSMDERDRGKISRRWI
ncbi:RTA1 like protein-domain-containing protein [Lasiosphaeria hispida]|uniref:RTA1 like protein-domain-containing protein n=1 Tax=Lasiosphaeria hispida TaxID=260671 RepID=A0AAJ0HG98_9PEZI|nr:RTA1 like protein-domain-containing protein [Lasiosphaeria hispida]